MSKKTSSKKSAEKAVAESYAKRSVAKTLRKEVTVRPQHSTILAKIFLWGSTATLLGTTVFWSLLSARIERFNADQLISPYLFSDHQTWSNAVLPGAHTFLLKWPVFYVLRLLHYSPHSFIMATVALSLCTVGGFALLLRKIERRPYVLGSIFLALSTILLLVPTQPYSGALLPTNFAMITTRNIEYVLFIWALYFAVKAPRLRSLGAISASVLLTLLIASDKIFMMLGLGGAVVAYAFARLAKHRQSWAALRRWAFVNVASALGALAGLSLLNMAKFTNIAGGSSPFQAVSSLSHIALGSYYSFWGLLTNFGANPASSEIIAKQVPASFAHGLWSASSPAYGMTLIVFAAATYGSIRLTWRIVRLKPTDAKNSSVSNWHAFHLALLSSLLVALAAFIASEHYYAVDARYLTIGLFALLIGGSIFLREKLLRPRHVLVCACLLIAVTPIAAARTFLMYENDRATYVERDQRNRTVASVLAQRHAKLLLGNYWIATPIKSYEQAKQLTIEPLETCIQPRQMLSSSAWQPDLSHTAFAYLAHGDTGGYNGCPLGVIQDHFGQPNETITIAGNPQHPQEMLLFYDEGTAEAKQLRATAPASIMPQKIAAQLPSVCPDGTYLNIVAHQDDDLLFMNPDTQVALHANKCIRIIFITAGDAGDNRTYWYGREVGAKNAYAAMAKQANVWVQQDATVNGHVVSVASLKEDPAIQLIFMRLPDGNLFGNGFHSRGKASLAALDSGHIGRITAVDDQSHYTRDQLISTLTELMEIYQPSEVHIQLPYDAGYQIHEHSDHVEAGRFSQAAFKQYSHHDTAKLVAYTGYPVREQPPNVSGEHLTSKESLFFAYAGSDGAVCGTVDTCQPSVYGKYLERQYATILSPVPSEELLRQP